MKIKVAAFGNYNEAFIEDRFIDGVNIIYSNDNNKGKTLVIQGLLFALGNTPIFPSGFDKRKYFFYTKIEVGKVEYEFLRKNRTIIVKSEGIWQKFDSISELKYFINKHLFSLPTIKKNNENKIVDIDLYYQLFFVGQDKRNTSNIQNAGQYNKADFGNMLRSMIGSKEAPLFELNEEQIKKKIKEKEGEKRPLSRKLQLVKKNPEIASQALKYSDREDVAKHRKSINEINGRISNYKRKRSREINRRTKLEHLLLELNSLNQTIDMGKIVCASCGADKIIYSNGDLSFEVSNSHVRNRVVSSIREQISLKGDVINELTGQINNEQDQLTSEMSQISPEVQDVLIFSQEIATEEHYSSELLKIQSDIESLKAELVEMANENAVSEQRNKEMMEVILGSMNGFYHDIDPDGIQIFNSLFSKQGENYSGSEEQEFYFCKQIALNNYFNHEFPIIMDSYRSGELSSHKEQRMIELYESLKKQVVLTSTLKIEEYDVLKYDGLDGINAIDYSDHRNSHVLQSLYVDRFKTILNEFGIAESEI